MVKKEGAPFLFFLATLLLAGCVQQLPGPSPSVDVGGNTITPAASVIQSRPSPSLSAAPSASTASQQKLFDWTVDQGARVSDGSVPFAFKLSDGRIRLYYCGPGGILSAISSDGLSFTKEDGVRFNSGKGATCDPTLVQLSDGRVRMYYKIAFGQGGPGQAVHSVYSAVSADGLNFQDEGLRIDSQKTGDNGWASVPDAIKLSDGRVRIYYVSGDPKMQGGIASAISSDGLVFTKEEGSRAPEMVDPAIAVLPDGKFVLFVAVIGLGGIQPKMPRGIYYLVSEDGLKFGPPIPVIQEAGVYDPSGVWIDGETIRVFYGKDEGGNPAQPKIVTKSITGKFIG